MYAGTIIEFDDQSQINKLPISEVRNRPLFAAVFTSDKGTEDWIRVTGQDFFNMYGETISFNRHGQPLLQAAMSINAGAELLCKRLVADDAALANIGIVATINKTEVQKTDATGKPLYLDADGEETVEETETPVMISESAVSYSIKTAEGVNDIDEAYNSIKADCSDGDYLLYVISDIGRGVSRKRIKLVPNYKMSKNSDFTQFTLYVMEDSENKESMTFATNTNLVVEGQNISLMNMIKNNSTQIQCYEDEEALEAYTQALADAAGIDATTMATYDIINCRTNKGELIPGIHMDTEGIDMQYTYGQMLASGDNGAFGAYPFKNKEEWSKQAINAINGTFDNSIYNQDLWKITAWFDANYPAEVKRALEFLVSYREDFMYFRDQGLDKNNLEAIKACTQNEAHNMFCATYPQSYLITDPYTKKQIPVTICYSMSRLMVTHCDEGAYRPAAGIMYGMVIPEAIYGTVSFIPTVCPDPVGNQKEMMEELQANYAAYIDNQLVIESEWTSQGLYSQWSFINNVMGIHEIIREIRTKVPAIRYSFINGEDLDTYKAAVESIINPYKSRFDILEIEYRADAMYSVNKIFYAVLKVKYRDFVQTEWFKITAINQLEVTTE